MIRHKAAKKRRKHSHAENRFGVIPTPVRLHADQERTGKGVTIAVVDAGFYPHPDLTKPVNRIVAYYDVTNPDAQLNAKKSPEAWDWHGTQTSVSAAGNGSLSNGLYRGLACDAHVVLVKVSDRGRITEENIARGLEWVLKNQETYNIRIVSISLGGDQDVPYQENFVDQLAEEAVRRGIVVVVAAGNSGCTDRHHTVPPANAPSVITVGGYDDQNKLDAELHLYCSSFGPTADGLIKPEMIAPAMWIAAPILPRTEFYKKAEALSKLTAAPDYHLLTLSAKLWKIAGLPESVSLDTNANEIRSRVDTLIQQNKIISTHYQHVDGTSFAAPIVTSVVAQMLEANPNLTPAAVKNILIATAERIRNAPVLRQGYGMLNAHAAVEQAANEQHPLDHSNFSAPRIEKNQLIFFCHADDVEKVTLAADFNHWNSELTRFEKDENGIWRAQIPLPDRGRYRYKFVLNGNRWIDDPSNGMKEPDDFGGFNSVINII